MNCKLKELKVNIRDTYYPVIKFGFGKMPLVIISGLSLTGLEGKGMVIANAYKPFMNDFTVYVLDRVKDVKSGLTVEDMAKDVCLVLNKLGIDSAFFYGVSQGGMIVQSILEIKPDIVKKAVFCSTTAFLSEKGKNEISKWIEDCEKKDVVSLNRKFFKSVYSETLLNSVKDLLPRLEKIGSLSDMERFIILSKACITFDGRLYKKAEIPSLVIGDKNDKIMEISDFKELAERLNARLIITEGFSHAVYDEDELIKEEIKNFFLEK